MKEIPGSERLNMTEIHESERLIMHLDKLIRAVDNQKLAMFYRKWLYIVF